MVTSGSLNWLPLFVRMRLTDKEFNTLKDAFLYDFRLVCCVGETG